MGGRGGAIRLSSLAVAFSLRLSSLLAAASSSRLLLNS